MKYTLPLAGLIALSLVCAEASAAVFERDWKTPGDGLLTYDDVSGREWLDLSVSLLSDQFPGVDREAKYQYVAGQTASDGLFAGFSIARREDVIALAQSAGIDTTSLDRSINFTPTRLLQELLSVTHYFPSSDSRLAIGLINELSPPPPITRRVSASFLDLPQSGGNGSTGLQISVSHTEFPAIPPGVMLYRTAVPEPHGFAQLLVYVVTFLVARHLRGF